MRATAAPSSPEGSLASGPSGVVLARRRLPRPVVWLLWLLGALIGSVVLGFLAGFARPRQPDPWSPSPPPWPAPPSRSQADPGQSDPAQDDPAQSETTSSGPDPAALQED